METISHECYVDLEVAKLLEEAGFNWSCREYYPTNFMTNRYEEYAKPTLDVAQKWLREVKAMHICVKPNEASANCKYFVTVIVNDTKWGNIQDDNRKTIMFGTYEEAQEVGIKKALELILEKEINNERV